jgi:6,7-dimethyl-8-ribityllumazine synthase
MKIYSGKANENEITIGVVVSRFNREITQELEYGALRRIRAWNITDDQVHLVRVPGAVEIPLAVKALLQNGCDAIVALGAVIRGETSHYESVCESVERGCSQLQLEFMKPVAFGVLTTENEDQAWARTVGGHGNKGAEAVDVAMEMIGLLREIQEDRNK